ncbi:sugar phosphate isomerase/epimerase [Reyranella sp. CPCC 100927]|uniref:sugar phosphate isomerase/epimerase family protein n=1 Tax=Reyranella sp. CPCC 100927 TaxID=2599616 RepID=UPI0011B3E03B|nr:sugar phosphate isomerase/epimerase family protein [Reyranella sp. CPCC 100927]TWS98295.1 sugar phosphate isomerase/epimerase [Reyranella sp. CPCC 100927]
MRDLAANPDLLSLNTATVRERWTLPQIIEGCARHEVRAIAPWRDQVAACGLDTAARLIRTHGLRVNGYCRGGMFPAADAAGRARASEDNRRAVDEALALGAECLILVVGGLPAGSKDIAGARQQVKDGIAALRDYAHPQKLPLAIEPLHPMYAADRACVNTLAQANDLCDSLGEGVGVAVDVYHVWWDPALEREIARAGRRILGFHVCDWLVPTSDMLLDRGMMGDGVIDIPRIRRWVEATGYSDCVEVEIFSAGNWWKRDPDEVLRTVRERYVTVC